jgi:cytoskeletal protein RodZ
MIATTEAQSLMNRRFKRLGNLSLVYALSGSMAMFAEPLPQTAQEPAQTQPAQVAPDDSNPTQISTPSSNNSNPSAAPVSNELPDAPAPAQPVQQNQNYSSSQQQTNPVPSGAAAAKAPTVRGAPASRTVGAAIAPAKQRQRRSLLIRAGLIAGACVAVGSAFALSKASPSKPPGAP